MTGRMPSLNGVRYNGIPLERSTVTFVDLLQAEGYRTGLIGKCHLQGMATEPPQTPRPIVALGAKPPPSELSEARRSPYGPDDYSAEYISAWKADPDRIAAVPANYYGFQHVEFCSGHGDQVSGHYERWLRERAPANWDKRGPDHAIEGGRSGHPQIYRSAIPEEAYPTRYILERTKAFLEEAAKGEAPFFLQCSFPDPHHPFTPPGRYWDMYDPAEVQLPRSFYQANRRSVPPVAALWEDFEAGRASTRWTYPFVADEAQAREMVAKTYGQITMIDDAVGELIASLNELGLAENTIICFMSDHGDYLGDHGLFLKGPMHYQSVIRTPFLWHDCDPTLARGRVDAPASTLDIAVSVLERIGLAPYNGIQGRSLLEPASSEARNLLIEQETQYPYLGFDRLISVQTLLSDGWRLSVWEGQPWGELYDLNSDPDELMNRWDDPNCQELRSALLLALINAIQGLRETSPFPLTVS